MTQVLVIGAGPTGLTAAVELARRGIAVRIFDKRDGPSPLSRAVGITPASIDLLTPSGAGPAIRSEAVRFDAMVMHQGADPILTLPLNFDDRSTVYGLPQDRTEAHLIDALARCGVTVEYNRPLTNYHVHGDHILADFGQHIHIEARYLIGADGSHSRVRATAGIHFDGHDLPGHWSIADVMSKTWPHKDSFAGYMLPGGEVAVVVPMASDRYRVISSLPDALKALPVTMEVDDLRRTSEFTIQVRQAERYRKGSVFLAGDAAHVHSPVGGRGMNLGIADAADLAARIAAGDLEGYEDTRMEVGEQVIHGSERARRMIQSTGAAKLVFQTAMRGLNHSESAKHAIVHQLLSG
ncbi:FAD-dependent oxidoreductase [Pseudooceanicola sp. MF1-13]|uniref:FAD-dependent oxidoreductase n=1 Tax=Pseudooceanicola sp. MF1-13 TaxID=3379095 RepID=UPI00389298A9